jgi:transposase
MSEGMEDLARRLVIGRKRDGRSIYDEQAKQELMQAARQPGVSVAKLARECGLNANQLSTWVRQHERKNARPPQAQLVQVPTPAFVPVAIEPGPAQPSEPALDLQARLRNGVVVDLRGCDLEQAGRLVEALGRLRCSASTKP